MRPTLRLAIAVLSLTGWAHAAESAPPKEIPLVKGTLVLDRMPEFEKRNQPENIEKLANEFWNLTLLPVWPDNELKRINRPKLLEANTQFKAKDYAAALETFKQYSLQKLKYADVYGFPAGQMSPFASSPVGIQWGEILIKPEASAQIIANADDLMKNILNTGEKRIEIGAPGMIDWQTPGSKGWAAWPYHVDAFSPLLAAYTITGKKEYLDKWAAFADDWAINQKFGVESFNACELPDEGSGGTEVTLKVLRYLAGVASLPNGTADLSAPTFARVMGKLVRMYIPLALFYHRSNPQNWTEASMPALEQTGFFLDEYKVGPLCLREMRRRLELVTPMRHFADGTDTERMPGYDQLYAKMAGIVLENFARRRAKVPVWMAPDWEKEYRELLDSGAWMANVHEKMRDRCRFLTGHLTATGEAPIGAARPGRTNRVGELFDFFQYFAPEMFADKNVAAIISIGQKKPIGVPDFTSEWFPYGGYYYLRAGWNPSDAYAFMFCSPTPGIGSMSAKNNNNFGLYAFGQDMLATGEVGAYDAVKSPLLVDGKEEYFHAGIPYWGHRNAMVHATHDTPAWRWHSSTGFDLAEGVYSGPYGNVNKGKPEEQAATNRNAIRGVSHNRQLQFLKSLGVWIVTDRIKSDKPHQLTQIWRLAAQPSSFPAFAADQIKVAADARTIQTSNPGANLSLYQFSPLALKYDSNLEKNAQSHRVHDFYRVGVSWESQSENLVLTLIYPRKDQKTDLLGVKEIKSDLPGVSGFEADTPEGVHVMYLAANQASSLKLGKFQATAESLLVTTAPDGLSSGLAMGVKDFQCDGKPLNTANAKDFEFTIKGGELTSLTPIYTPIELVKVSPEVSGFMDEQAITLSCATPGTEIRYTLDGSDPTPESPLYKEPLTLTQSAVLKARGMRPGLKAIPAATSGTQAGFITRVDYTKLDPQNVKPAQGKNWEKGLAFDYFEGKWFDLLCNLSAQKPVKSGVAASLFEGLAKNEQVAYAYKYTGAIEIPTDGLYTFQCPRELLLPDIMAGYELQLWIGDKQWYPCTQITGLGGWQIALKKGKYPFTLVYADFRKDAAQKFNVADLNKLVWDGVAPELTVSGPGIEKQAIPAAWFSHAAP